MMLAISALVSAPRRVMSPARIQTARRRVGEPSWLAMRPGLRKIPEPMTPPTTIMIVVKRPKVGRRPLWLLCGWDDAGVFKTGIVKFRSSKQGCLFEDEISLKFGFEVCHLSLLTPAATRPLKTRAGRQAPAG